MQVAWLKRPRNSAYRAGFSLVEMSVVLVIIAIVVSSGLTLSTSVAERNAFKETQDELEYIAGAIQRFYNRNGYLPCPANPEIPRDNSTYGTSTCTVTNMTVGINSKRGMVPIRALNLPDKYASDAWSRRYIYQVSWTSAAATSFTEINNHTTTFGRLSIQNESSPAVTIAQNVAFAVMSAGMNRYGSYHKDRDDSSLIGCTAGPNYPHERVNCANSLVLRDVPFNPKSATAANQFDDFIVWRHADDVTSASGRCQFGAPVFQSPDTTYQATTDGIVNFTASNDVALNGCVHSSTISTCTNTSGAIWLGRAVQGSSSSLNVRRGFYYLVQRESTSTTGMVRWTPLICN